jgi:hypothetical protein
VWQLFKLSLDKMEALFDAVRRTDRLMTMIPYEGSYGLLLEYTPQKPRWAELATAADRDESGQFVNDGYCHMSAIPPSDSRYDRALLVRFFDQLGIKLTN